MDTRRVYAKLFGLFLLGLGVLWGIGVILTLGEEKETPDLVPGAVYCNPAERSVGACIQIYEPVCGWYDPVRIRCIKYPCAKEYSNSCEACADPNVLYYTHGPCPR